MGKKSRRPGAVGANVGHAPEWFLGGFGPALARTGYYGLWEPEMVRVYARTTGELAAMYWHESRRLRVNGVTEACGHWRDALRKLLASRRS